MKRFVAVMTIAGGLLLAGAAPAWAPRDCGNCVTASPGQVKANHPLLIKLTGFTPGTTVALVLDGPELATVRLSQATIDERGTAKVHVLAPRLPPGPIRLSALSTAGEAGTAVLVITASGGPHV